MPEFDDTNKGALFKNKEKTADNPNWADYQGSLNVKCPHCQRKSNFWLNAWLKVAKKGKIKGDTFMSVAIDPKKERQPNRAPPTPQQQEDDPSDSIPF